jgi:hypothetical protein
MLVAVSGVDRRVVQADSAALHRIGVAADVVRSAARSSRAANRLTRTLLQFKRETILTAISS